jgi:hypothetical protein
MRSTASIDAILTPQSGPCARPSSSTMNLLHPARIFTGLPKKKSLGPRRLESVDPARSRQTARAPGRKRARSNSSQAASPAELTRFSSMLDRQSDRRQARTRRAQLPKLHPIVGNSTYPAFGLPPQARMIPTAKIPSAAVRAAARSPVLATFTMASSPASRCTMNAPTRIGFTRTIA